MSRLKNVEVAQILSDQGFDFLFSLDEVSKLAVGTEIAWIPGIIDKKALFASIDAGVIVNKKLDPRDGSITVLWNDGQRTTYPLTDASLLECLAAMKIGCWGADFELE
jgi:hypothetical protein